MERLQRERDAIEGIGAQQAGVNADVEADRILIEKIKERERRANEKAEAKGETKDEGEQKDKKGDKPDLDSRGLDKNRHKPVAPTDDLTDQANLILILKGINGPGTASPSTPYSKSVLIAKIKLLDKKVNANTTTPLDELMEKYTRLLLQEPAKIPYDVKLYGPIMQRLNELSDDDIKSRVFRLFTPITDSASTKKNLVFNALTSSDAIRNKMFNIIVNHPNRVALQNGWGLTNDTITKEGMTTDEIQEVLKKKTHHIIPVIASNYIPTLLLLVGPTTKEFGFVINSQSDKKVGMHWRAVYFNRKRAECCFFDSLVSEPTDDVMRGIK